MTAVLSPEGPLQVAQPAARPLNPLWLEVFNQLAYHILGEDVTALDAFNLRALATSGTSRKQWISLLDSPGLG